MRPNVDLPWSVHGSVKDYADENNLTLTEAYRTLLERGLEDHE